MSIPAFDIESLKDNVIVLKPEDFIDSKTTRQGNKYVHEITIKLNGEDHSFLMEKHAFITDDDYFIFLDRTERKFYAFPSIMHEGGLDASCYGSHGGAQNACDTCRWNMERDRPEQPPITLSTDPCTLSKFYFNKPYWFQQRLIPTITVS